MAWDYRGGGIDQEGGGVRIYVNYRSSGRGSRIDQERGGVITDQG